MGCPSCETVIGREGCLIHKGIPIPIAYCRKYGGLCDSTCKANIGGCCAWIVYYWAKEVA